jgi:hypothetical protein
MHCLLTSRHEWHPDEEIDGDIMKKSFLHKEQDFLIVLLMGM